MAEAHRPRISLRYVFQYAVQHFLKEADNHKMGELIEEQKDE